MLASVHAWGGWWCASEPSTGAFLETCSGIVESGVPRERGAMEHVDVCSRWREELELTAER
jgi:hypothetical protein